MAKPVFATNDVPSAAQFNSWFVNVNFGRVTTPATVTSSTTLVTVSDLVIPVEANSIYSMRAVILYGGPAAADIKVLFRTPSGASFAAAGHCLLTSAASQTDYQVLPYSANASETWGCLGGGTQLAMVHGVLTTGGSAGNFSLEFAQNVSNASATSIQGNSHIDLRRVS